MNEPTGSIGSVGKMPPKRKPSLSKDLHVCMSRSHDGNSTTPYA